MSETTFLFVGLIAFFLPIASYCLVLAMVNRRYQPAMINGSWDTIGLLLALSGVLLVCGPGIMYRHFNRLSLYQGVEKDDEGNPVKKEPPREVFQEKGNKPVAAPVPWNAWWAIAWAGYYLFIVSVAVLLVLSRRDKTVIYNVDPDLFDAVLERTLAKCGLTSMRVGRTVYIGPREAAPVQEMQ